MTSIYVTRKIPELGIKMLTDKGYTVAVNEIDAPLTHEQLIEMLKIHNADGVISLLTDTIDARAFDASPNTKIFANYAVGFNNVDIPEAKKRGITITNTPGALSNTVAEHTMALILAISTRTVEGDRLMRSHAWNGWGPMQLLGTDLAGKTLGILGAGRIGSRLAHQAHSGFDMNIIYHDVNQNPQFEADTGAKYCATVEEVLKNADVVSIHVPLMPGTEHMINAETLKLMKPTAFLVNTSRGRVIDEVALTDALKNKVIKGAALDVFENEPKTCPGLCELDNVVLTPHIASATEAARDEMAKLAADNLIAFFEGRTPANLVQ